MLNLTNQILASLISLFQHGVKIYTGIFTGSGSGSYIGYDENVAMLAVLKLCLIELCFSISELVCHTS